MEREVQINEFKWHYSGIEDEAPHHLTLTGTVPGKFRRWFYFLETYPFHAVKRLTFEYGVRAEHTPRLECILEILNRVKDTLEWLIIPNQAREEWLPLRLLCSLTKLTVLCLPVYSGSGMVDMLENLPHPEKITRLSLYDKQYRGKLHSLREFVIQKMSQITYLGLDSDRLLYPSTEERDAKLTFTFPQLTCLEIITSSVILTRYWTFPALREIHFGLYRAPSRLQTQKRNAIELMKQCPSLTSCMIPRCSEMNYAYEAACFAYNLLASKLPRNILSPINVLPRECITLLVWAIYGPDVFNVFQLE